ncbi:hypothetical protein [Actinoallomurus sp. CA-142502]|uniref:hypothetical protein n=1 Tax=Actinoallomurus sp. CA-142502 TaxID=3239885 RepID=UPI003D929E15
MRPETRLWRKTARKAQKTAQRRRIRRAETAEMSRLLRRMQRFFAHRSEGFSIESAGRLVGVGIGEAYGYERFIEALTAALRQTADEDETTGVGR